MDLPGIGSLTRRASANVPRRESRSRHALHHEARLPVARQGEGQDVASAGPEPPASLMKAVASPAPSVSTRTSWLGNPCAPASWSRSTLPSAFRTTTTSHGSAGA
jgi:hypothetical protein